MSKKTFRHFPRAFTITAVMFAFCGTLSATNVKHAVILVMDGARYNEETWGAASHANIPKIDSLARFGAVLTQFRTKTNSGNTPYSETNPGHARLTTGSVQDIANDGSVLPLQPGIFQQYRKQTGRDSTKAWVITSKDKLVILSGELCTMSGVRTGGFTGKSNSLVTLRENLPTGNYLLKVRQEKGSSNRFNLQTIVTIP